MTFFEHLNTKEIVAIEWGMKNFASQWDFIGDVTKRQWIAEAAERLVWVTNPVHRAEYLGELLAAGAMGVF